MALGNGGRAHRGLMTPQLVRVQERGPVSLLEVRKETVGVDNDLGRMVIGQAEKQS